MIVSASVTIPANTSENDAIIERVKLAYGVLKRVKICFPPGPAGLAHIRVFYRGWQIIPWRGGGDLAWDDAIFEFDMNYLIAEEPYEVVIQAWNEDDTYEHTISFWFELDEMRVVTLTKMPQEMEV